MSTPQWTPSDTDIAEARLTDFARFAGREGADYQSLWQWSVDNAGEFWTQVWRYFDIQSPDPGPALVDDSMPGARWFPDARLNYVDQVIRNARTDRPAIVHVGEDGARSEVSWGQLLSRTAAVAHHLRELGVQPGDRVVGYLPNVPEAVIAFLATASVGAVWSACGQDYTAQAALTRLGQLEPVVLIAADGYHFNGKWHDKLAEVAQLQTGLPTLRDTVAVQYSPGEIPGTTPWASVSSGEYALVTTPRAFDDPLWVVFSSGTTGLPKGIMHGHGGVLLEHLKAVSLQSDIGRDDTFLWYTSPSWMMWNYLVGGLLAGATIVTYAGSPAYPWTDALFGIAARLGVTYLGTSPGYVLACIKAGARPAAEHDLSALRVVGITGSALPPSSSEWLAREVGVPVSSISGGTDVVTAFVGGTRTVPVWPGELSAPFLGVALDAWDLAGNPVRGQVGELVVTKPMPSMPVRFWRDEDGLRYRAAYFDDYPGVWRHGDWITITDHGSVIVHGRSDSTLNRNGIRMGTADIYQAVEALDDITEALVLGIEYPDASYWMPMFVHLAPGAELSDALVAKIKDTIRTQVSPRHVPDDVIAAPAVPHTRTGKKLEVPLKRIFLGADPAVAVDRSAVDAPELIDWYAAYNRSRKP